MDRDITWTIDGIKGAYLTGQTPRFTRGREIQLEFIFSGQATITREQYAAGVQYGSEDAVYSFNYGGSSTTRTVTFREAYNELLQYLDYHGDELVARGTSDRGQPWFRERLPENAPVDSLIVPIEAGEDVVDQRNFWGIIVSGDDLSEPPSTIRRVQITVFLLARLEEHTSRDEVYDDLGDHRSN